MKELARKPVFIITVVAIAVLIGGYVYFSIPKKPGYEFVIAKKGELTQEVSVTGRVKAASEVDLAFEKSGRVAWIGVKVGDKAASGQILIQLENADLLAQLAEAEAKVKAENATLTKLKGGNRPEEIQIQEVKVQNAKAALIDAKKNMVDKLRDAYTKADDAVRNKTDQFFTNPKTSNPQINFQVADSALELEIKRGRVSVESILVSWWPSLDVLDGDSNLVFFINAAKLNLAAINSFLANTALAVNALTVSSSLSQTIIDGWKSDVSGARTNVNAASSNVSGAEEKLKTAGSNLKLAENELALEAAGSRSEDIASQEAKVEEAQANAKNIQAQIAKAVIRAPFGGIVTKQEAKVGEIVAANAVIVSLISEGKFEVEANIPESDTAKVKIGNKAGITLDAYSNDVKFEAVVTAIDPAGTIIEGVATYETTLQFAKEDARIKSGMSANVDILTERRGNVIILPQRAVITKNGDKFVRIMISGAIQEKKVLTGLRASDGNVEISEGVGEGDKVIIFIK